jgi:hypothetical protein
MKAYGGVDVYIHIFLTSALAGGEWTASRTGLFTPGEKPRYPLARRLGGPQSRSGRRGEEKILEKFFTFRETPNFIPCSLARY